MRIYWEINNKVYLNLIDCTLVIIEPKLCIDITHLQFLQYAFEVYLFVIAHQS